jgi:hypothetical protein
MSAGVETVNPDRGRQHETAHYMSRDCPLTLKRGFDMVRGSMGQQLRKRVKRARRNRYEKRFNERRRAAMKKA